VPELRALVALKQDKPAKAIELLRSTTPYEEGQPPSSFFGFYGMYYPAYLRGEAYLAERQGLAATAEFRKILDHRGVVISDPIGALGAFAVGSSVPIIGDEIKAKPPTGSSCSFGKTPTGSYQFSSEPVLNM
jgi:eukaryotic-like serine/threonine-protein kinase